VLVVVPLPPVVVVLVVVLVEVEVVGLVIDIFTKFVQVPVERTLINVAASGTEVNVYPAINAALEIPVTKGLIKSTLEYKLNGPVLAPGDVNVTMTFIEFYI
jgi:hypothetical protein